MKAGSVMDDQTRNGLLARLSEVKARESQLLIRLRAHTENIEEIRSALGNPYFYSGRPDGDPESKSRFTGYASHVPGLQLLREYQEVAKEIESIKSELRAAGLDSE
jgi:hypothetical protein